MFIDKNVGRIRVGNMKFVGWGWSLLGFGFKS